MPFQTRYLLTLAAIGKGIKAVYHMKCYLVEVGRDHLLGGEHPLRDLAIQVQVWPEVVRTWGGVKVRVVLKKFGKINF